MQGLYKVEMQTARGSPRGVMYAYDRKILGGNSAFAFVGTFQTLSGGAVSVEILVQRHRKNSNFQSILAIDRLTLRLAGERCGDKFHFRGNATELPGVPFTLLMTPISEEDAMPPMAVGPNPLANGLYALEAELFDGVTGGGNAGVLVLLDGTMRGGDGSFGYIGSYTSADGRWKGEAVVREHSSANGNRLLFGGGREVGIGYSGTYNEDGGNLQCMALNGKRSIRYGATMRKIADG